MPRRPARAQGLALIDQQNAATKSRNATMLKSWSGDRYQKIADRVTSRTQDMKQQLLW
jgi:hypothetical protein